MFKSFFGDRKSRKQNKMKQYRPLRFESLEGRTLMANDIVAAHAILVSGNDFITSADKDTAIFNVQLSDAPAHGDKVKVTFHVSDATVAKVSPATITFTDKNFDSPHKLTITGLKNGDQVGTINYTVDSSVTSTDPDFTTAPSPISMSNVDHIGKILGSSKSGKTPAVETKTTEEGGVATIKLHLNFAPTAPVTVNLHSDNLAEGVTDVDHVTFDETHLEAEIHVTGQPDGVKSHDPGKYNLVFDAATSTDLHFAGFQLPNLKMTNKNQVATIIVDDKKLVTNELGGTDHFSVVLSQKPTATVDVPIQVPAGAFVSVDQAVLHFDDQNWNVPQVVTVTGHDDGVAGKKDNTYKIDLGAAISTDPKYANLDVKANVVSVKNVHGAIDPQFNGNYVGAFSGLVFFGFPMQGTLNATISGGNVVVNSLHVTISQLPAGTPGAVDIGTPPDHNFVMTIDTSGTGSVTASGNNLLVSLKFANDGSLLANKEVNNIPLKLVNGVPALSGDSQVHFDGSIFGVGDVPVDVTWNISKGVVI